ncbi:cytochrome P450 [Haloarchaeobius amylolyticus]|uniref:cytochrome P450 n=1 Tax=Haloarchaeobius amylolyticus TaxID=1198296 RepID=UPI0022713BFB|nr:cytochrome P450 [Haloarchaeobius amylolyticus]
MAHTSSRERDAPADSADSDGLPPGPDGLPVLGNTLQLASDPASFYDELASYGDLVAYRAGGMQFCTLLHPDYVEQVLVTDADRFGKWGLTDFGVDFAAEGILFTEGETWKRQRTMAQPAFQLDRIRGYGDSMQAFAAALADGWDDGDVVAATDTFSDLTLRILTKSLFDLDLDESDRGAVVTRAATEFNRWAEPSLSTFVLPNWVPTPRRRRLDRAMGDFEALVDDLIAERAAAEGDHDDLLAMLLSARGEDGDISDRELRDTMMTFLFAGHETTSLALTYTCYLLATHPDVADRLRAEVDEVVGEDPVDVLDLPALSFLDRVVTESMRLYPPAFILFRKAREDVTLGGYTIPEGTKLTLPLFRIHRDDRWYDDPDSFRPDRWTDDFEDFLPEYAYFPFGGGPRHCIGMRFARMELKLVLATLVQRCRFEYLGEEPPQPRMGATYQPDRPMELRVEKR